MFGSFSFPEIDCWEVFFRIKKIFQNSLPIRTLLSPIFLFKRRNSQTHHDVTQNRWNVDDVTQSWWNVDDVTQSWWNVNDVTQNCWNVDDVTQRCWNIDDVTQRCWNVNDDIQRCWNVTQNDGKIDDDNFTGKSGSNEKDIFSNCF